MTYNRLFTLHGIVMIFLFMIPAIPSGFGNFVLPLMIGARDVAFPRLNLGSMYVYLLGASIALWGMIHGGVDTGWTFYTPYSSTTTADAFPVILGAFVIGFSSIMTGLNFIVTVHTLRAPGMTWMRLPLFVWAVYGTSLIQVLATPVLGLALLVVGVENTMHFGLFDPTRGGDPLLFQHLFWFYSHPAVYIMVLPAMGVMSEIICAFSRKNAYGYNMIAYSSLGIAFVGFFAWGHHMFVTGQSSVNAGIFGVISMLVGVFTAIKVFNWVGTMYRGSIQVNTPFLYACGFLYFVVFGGMTGIALATVGLDVHWHDTYFVIAHFHFVMVGAVIMGFLAALHYWFPKMFARTYHDGWGMVAATLIIFGFNATFIPQFLLGNAGMPRRYYEYPDKFQALNVASTAGASVLALGLVIVLIYLVVALVSGKRCEQNPWGSKGFEWMTQTPPTTSNFDVIPTITTGPHDYRTNDNSAAYGIHHV
jgi:cytochrome c oxidase subunit 1